MSTTTQLVCPDCGREFVSRKSLGQHRRQQHPQQSNGATLVDNKYLVEIREQLSSMLSPMREQLDRLNAAISQNEVEHASLLRARRQLVSVLNKLDPPPPTTRRPTVSSKINTALPAHREFRELLRELIEEGELEEFTVKQLYDAQRERQLGLSMERVTVIIQELHDDGLLRLDRISRGGGKVYKPTSQGDRDE